MSPPVRAMALAALSTAAVLSVGSAQPPSGKKGQHPAPAVSHAPGPEPRPPAPASKERFVYSVEWRLIRAGTATVEAQFPNASMRLESGGLVASLFKVDDLYTVTYDAGAGIATSGRKDDPSFCALTARLESMEGKRHHEARVTYDRSANRAHYVETDLSNNQKLHEASVDLPPCASDTLGALIRLRGIDVQVGKPFELPVSDGRHSALVKIDPQEREEIKIAAGTFKTVRYEASLLNGVIYPRKGRVWIWYTDDARRLPVQIRLRTGFPVGTVTLELEKQEGP